MNITTLTVPAGIRYISDWANMENGYKLGSYSFPHIVDKKITGCGFTEYCLTNDMDIILCSPRKILLENKEDQHSGEVFYFRNELESFVNFEKDISTNGKKKEKILMNKDLLDKQQKLTEVIKVLGQNLNAYISRRRADRLPIKILVTYDSFRLVKDLLGDDIYSFFTVVDEFQSIFVDARFKSDTELGFLKQLQLINNLCFVSATPMIDKYLDRLDEFKDLPYFEFDWAREEPCRVIRPNLTVHSIKSLLGTVSKIIESYRNGQFAKASYLTEEGNIAEIESKEAVIYVNSVKNICDIIRKCEMRVNECNILCANTKDNLKKLKAAFNTHGEVFDSIGKVPKRGEPHRMFTLCTRTVYLGADFYSTCAQSFVVSDANIDSLSVDITLDLPQILGRQRLVENPWKNSATLFFRSISDVNKITREEFNAKINKKLEKTEKLLKAIDIIEDYGIKQAVAERYRVGIDVLNYSEDYVSVDNHEGKILVPILNRLVLMAEERAFEIQQIDYKDRFSVFNTIRESNNVVNESLGVILDRFSKLTTFQEQMRYVCLLDDIDDSTRRIFLNSIPLELKNYYVILGPEVCASFSYLRYRLEEEYRKRANNQDLDVTERILGTFQVGFKYTIGKIRELLSMIYQDTGLIKTPKATDLLDYFEVKEVKLTVDRGKREGGYLILGIKSL